VKTFTHYPVFLCEEIKIAPKKAFDLRLSFFWLVTAAAAAEDSSEF
jgi:hypothetical protein